ncbi:MAG TPA: zf-HC2 domain-containing protein [Gemmatimonadaceae bacterium]
MSGSTPTITCEVFADRLMDFLEDDLDGAARAAMEAHARRCAECGALLADLRRVSRDASRLPSLAPSRDLWAGIAERIEAPVVGLAGRRRLWTAPRLGGLAAAAALLLAAGLGYRALRHAGSAPSVPAVHVAAATPSGSDTARTAAPSPAPDQAPASAASGGSEGAHARLAASRAAEATPQAIEKSYDGEIAGLRAIIKQRHSRLDSATVAVLEHNLAVIDSAIAQCKTALARDPNSRFLMQSLSQSLDIKVQLMRMTAGLPSAT